jgi:hypothetical protein
VNEETQKGTPINDTHIPNSRGAPWGANSVLMLEDQPSVGEDVAAEYFANRDPEYLSSEIRRIVESTKQIMRAAGIFRRARANYNLFYAKEGGTFWDENLREDGDNGGSMHMSVNVMKNAIDHLIQMVTSHKPAVDPVTLNSSLSANDTTEVAKSIIDSRLHVQKEINTIDEGLRQTPVLGAAYLHPYWNPFKGKKTDKPGKGSGHVRQFHPDPAVGEVSPISFQGDIELECLNLLDVYYDLSISSWDKINDCVVRVFRNRYDCMVQWPDKADFLRQTPPRTVLNYDEFLPSPTFVSSQAAKTPSQEAMIELHIYYHKITPSCPFGKMQVQLPNGDVIEPAHPLPEWVKPGELPIHRMCPDGMVGTPHGYAATTSTGGLQEGLNIGSSAMLTNMAAFSRKLILMQKGEEVDVANITGDLKLLEVNFNAQGKPPIESLDLLGSQNELIGMLGWFVGQIEQITGANSIVRGDPKGVTAGVAVNLYQSMALQSASIYEDSRSNAVSWWATTVVRAYQAFPDVERDIMVMGTNKTAYLKNFYGANLKGIDSFVVEPGNPGSRTLAMRYNMATAIKQDGVIIPPDKLVHLIKTGDWDSAVEGASSLDDVIRRENEQMMMGLPVFVIPGDDPVRHAQGHLVVLSNAKVRENPSLVQGVMMHLEQHLQKLAQGDVIVKLAAGMLPMGPFPAQNSPLAHGDTPAPNHGTPPAPPPGAAPGKPHPNPLGPQQAPGRKLEAVKAPPVPPAPPIPGIGGQS